MQILILKSVQGCDTNEKGIKMRPRYYMKDETHLVHDSFGKTLIEMGCAKQMDAVKVAPEMLNPKEENKMLSYGQLVEKNLKQKKRGRPRKLEG